MNTVIHHAADRGKGDFEWLTTRYSFSFANWYNPERLGFGKLLVINDDTIAPGTGFGTHQHNNMEIITVVTEGTLAHKDSLGTEGIVKPGEVEVMSAGSGVQHSEYNASKEEPLSLFQIWIESNVVGGAPRYDQKAYPLQTENGFQTIVAPFGTQGVLGIQQDAYITRATFLTEGSLTYEMKNPEHDAYVFVIDGKATAAGIALHDRDAVGVTDTDSFEITSKGESLMLVIEVPLF